MLTVGIVTEMAADVEDLYTERDDQGVVHPEREKPLRASRVRLGVQGGVSEEVCRVDEAQGRSARIPDLGKEAAEEPRRVRGAFR